MRYPVPDIKGKEAWKEIIKKSIELKKKHFITFERDAEDPYQAVLAILNALDRMLEGCTEYKKIRMLVRAVAEEKGEKSEEGTYIWPRHLKEAAEDIGMDWKELKDILKETDFIEYDPKKKKYIVRE